MYGSLGKDDTESFAEFFTCCTKAYLTSTFCPRHLWLTQSTSAFDENKATEANLIASM